MHSTHTHTHAISATHAFAWGALRASRSHKRAYTILSYRSLCRPLWWWWWWLFFRSARGVRARADASVHANQCGGATTTTAAAERGARGWVNCVRACGTFDVRTQMPTCWYGSLRIACIVYTFILYELCAYGFTHVGTRVAQQCPSTKVRFIYIITFCPRLKICRK